MKADVSSISPWQLIQVKVPYQTWGRESLNACAFIPPTTPSVIGLISAILTCQVYTPQEEWLDVWAANQLSVMLIHNLIHMALLVSGNVIWLQPTALKGSKHLYICIFFLNFAFPTYFVSHYCCRRALYAWMLYSMEEFVFWVAPFDCGLANWSCMSTSVKDDMLVRIICHVCFVSRFGLLTI